MSFLDEFKRNWAENEERARRSRAQMRPSDPASMVNWASDAEAIRSRRHLLLREIVLRLAGTGIVADAFDRPALFELTEAPRLVAESEGVTRSAASVDPRSRPSSS